MRRFFVENLTDTDKTVSIKGDEFHHLKTVLHLKVGDNISLFNGKGNDFLGSIEVITKDEAKVAIVERLKGLRESPIEVILCQGLAKSEKMDLIIQKATELGVSRVIPFFTSRTVPKLDGNKMANKVERWQRIALEAVKQCGRSLTPNVEMVKGFQGVLKGWDGYLRLILWEGEETNTIKKALKEWPLSKIVTLVGPEGGFTTDEVEEAKRSGFIPVSLGPRILRTETASIAILSILQYELGDMGEEKPLTKAVSIIYPIPHPFHCPGSSVGRAGD
ncbi:MAG: 16S rRNA (uracil(1498)-N(3))-methyltransferase [Deltaproteobacteria bacterium]|nr:16S rRNA (uracil(1498)-N(3))-methyltransferase [Deltaproteobacteria bacterium]